MCSKNTTRCWKLCLTSVWIKMVLFCKLEGYLAKKCVLHQMCSKNTTRCWKLCLTSFCVKNYLLPNSKDVLLKNAFCMKSAQRIQLHVENCLTSVWVKMFLFFKLEGYLIKKCLFHQMCSTNTTRCWKLCFTSVWVKMVLFSKLEGYLAKKCVLHQICWKNTTRCWKLCLTSFCVKNYPMPNYKHVCL